LVEAVNEGTTESLPALNCLMSLSVCPAGLITPLSWSLLQAHNACDGTARIVTPEQYYSLPALYVDAVSVIESERRKYQVSNGDK
jgi:hypothetical protein